MTSENDDRSNKLTNRGRATYQFRINFLSSLSVNFFVVGTLGSIIAMALDEDALTSDYWVLALLAFGCFFCGLVFYIYAESMLHRMDDE